MKKIKYLALIVLAISLWSCSSKPEANLELFSPQAFAFDIGDAWEVNASVGARGLANIDSENMSGIKLYYNVDLITPEADTIESIFDNTLEEEDAEVTELTLDAQIELDSSFSSGKYILLFKVTDENTQQNKIIKIPFKIEKE